MDFNRLIDHLSEEEKRLASTLLEVRGLPISFLDNPANFDPELGEECWKTVLDACALFNKKRDTKVTALQQLSQLYVLFWKGLYKEASERLQELKKGFSEKEEFTLLQLLNQLELYLSSVDWETEDFEGKMDQLIKNYVITTHKAIDLLSRWSLDTKLNRHLIQRGPSKNIMDTYDYDHLKEEVYVHKNKNTMSVYAQYYQLRAEKHLYELDGNYKQLYFTNVQIISLMEGNPEQFTSSISNMVYAYYHLGKTALRVDMEQEAWKAVEKIRNLNAKGDISIYDKDNFSLSLEIDIYLHRRNFKDAFEQIHRADRLYKETGYSNAMVKDEHQKFYCYQFALAEFWLGEYSKAKQLLEHITANPAQAKIFKDLLANAYRLELLILAAQGNWSELELKCDIATDFWKSAQLFNQLEASFVQTLRRLIKNQGQTIAMDLSRWRNELEMILSDPMESKSLDNFDLIGWLEHYLPSLSERDTEERDRSQTA